MTPEEFTGWLEGKLNGHPAASATPELTMRAHEIINGELRPTVVAIFPEDAFVISVARAAS